MSVPISLGLRLSRGCVECWATGRGCKGIGEVSRDVGGRRHIWYRAASFANRIGRRTDTVQHRCSFYAQRRQTTETLRGPSRTWGLGQNVIAHINQTHGVTPGQMDARTGMCNGTGATACS